ncbi:RNA polymerase II transcriptional coactivator KELP [Sesamum angolense]|uniref:RNA polymerase II transcriptional coactivator KELP n=1 Tax=Sesamum angolense TaxID=2727404 RepID=A0AAE1T6F5_9LAMI|nr:RNA polymerase II transcriptional coactivator KELP [Sesamum angolense]
MDETDEYKIRKSASEKLQMNLSEPTRKKFVRQVVESYLREQQAKAEEEQQPEEEEEEEEEEDNGRKTGGREYDDEEWPYYLPPICGKLVKPTSCGMEQSAQISHFTSLPADKRRVTLSEFRGKTLVSIREYYKRDGKELPSAKGISLTAEQWASFKKNVPAIEKAIKKMESR